MIAKDDCVFGCGPCLAHPGWARGRFYLKLLGISITLGARPIRGAGLLSLLLEANGFVHLSLLEALPRILPD